MPALSQTLNFIRYQSSATNYTTSTVSVVYPNTATTMLVYTSDKYKGDGYFGGSDGLHTVTYTATPTFIGTMSMQATLASEPAESDWFTVAGASQSYNTFDDRSTSTVNYFNFTGNFVWVRSQIQINDGAVEAVHYNH